MHIHIINLSLNYPVCVTGQADVTAAWALQVYV